EFPTMPDPAPEQPTPQPTPETPRRRQYTQPIFRFGKRVAAAGLVLFTAGMMQAQTDSTHKTTPAHTTPMGTQTQSQPQTQKGWTMFDDRIGKEYNLSA